jgi:hypothetical protein
MACGTAWIISKENRARQQYVQVQGHVDTVKNHCGNLKDLRYLENAPK